MLRQSFSKAGAKQEGLSRLELDDAISRERPELQGRIAYFDEQGKCAHTLVFENEIFKGPSREDQIRFIEQECAILQHLEGKGLPVPVVTTVGKDSVFFGMTRIEGLSTMRVSVELLSSQDKDTLARDIAKFIHGFAKAFTDEDAERLLKHVVNKSPNPDDLIKVIKERSFQNALNGNTYECVVYIDEYAEKLKGRPEIVYHNDLHGGNIITDADTTMLTGIVDFGYVSKGVPEMAFFELSRAFPADFVKRVCSAYSDMAETKVEYRDVLLLRLALGAQALSTAISKQVEGDVLMYKSDIADSLRLLKAVDKSAAPAPETKAFKP